MTRVGPLLLWSAVAAMVLSPLAPRGVTASPQQSSASDGDSVRPRRQRARMAARRASARRRARMRHRARARRRMRRVYRSRMRLHRHAPRAVVRRWASKQPPPLVLRPIEQEREYVLTPEDDDGHFGEKAFAKARRALATDEGKRHAIHPRLLELLYRSVRHFRAPYVYVVSGYRDDRDTSRHSHGRAVDVILPGVPDRRLAYYLTRQGFVGVGLYPRSKFVHLDVRHRSYFWLDRSAPGRPDRPRPALRKRARITDRRAARRGETRVEALGALDEAEIEGADGE